MRQEVYTSLLRSQEQARADAVRDTPLFTVVDHTPGLRSPRGAERCCVLAFMLGLMVAVAVAFIREATRVIQRILITVRGMASPGRPGMTCGTRSAGSGVVRSGWRRGVIESGSCPEGTV
jgi:hypothetical protein